MLKSNFDGDLDSKLQLNYIAHECELCKFEEYNIKY